MVGKRFRKWLASILIGIANWVEPKEEIEKLAEKRLKICGKCQDDLFMCNECGCVLSFKVRSPKATCPLNKW